MKHLLAVSFASASFGVFAFDWSGLVSGAFVRSDIFGTTDSGTLCVRRSSDAGGCVLLVR